MIQWHGEPTSPGYAILPDVCSRPGLEEQIPDEQCPQNRKLSLTNLAFMRHGENGLFD
jgi:hypothetical protein